MRKLNQFLRLEKYGMCPSKQDRAGFKGTTKRGAIAVLMEGWRELGHAPHVPNPIKPRLVYGMPLPELAQFLTQRVESARDSRGYRLHRKTQVLIGVVVSYPIAICDMKKTEGAVQSYNRWESEVVEFAKRRWPNHLKAVVRHTDEKYAHLHLYLVPNFDAGESNLHVAHPGMAAFWAAAPVGDTSATAIRMRRQAWSRAMRGLQDAFYAAVSVHFGHDRVGPRRYRVPQKDMQRERQRQAALELAEKEAAEKRRQANEYYEFIRSQCAEMKAAVNELIRTKKEEIERQRDRLRTALNRLHGALEWVADWRKKVPAEVKKTYDDAATMVDHGPDSDP